ncbi:origin recognition complex subunit 1 isoform X2 [Ooceraea biroi]|uniref:origin recognition complex subunit 1 isoform X2 n=1 Tax=Ooceraea biroi TaxID=2015173 RepID=UPI000F08B8F9|nr:origin recognition complex subunit 1 isoform X2 [Ooceraea biroi]
MARRKCTEEDISLLLESNSDFDDSYVPDKSKDYNSSDSSDFKEILDKNKKLLLQGSLLRQKQSSLRLKLRRSTEQSTYKIDTESEDERPRRSTRNAKLRGLQDENQVPHTRRNTRAIKLPTRYSDYECFSPKSPVSRREQTNCDDNERQLSSANTTKRRKQTVECMKDDDSNDSDCIFVESIPETPSTRSGMSKVPRTRSSKCIGEESKRKTTDKVLLSEEINSKLDTITYESLSATPRRRPRGEKTNPRGILTVSNKCEPTVAEDENKQKNVDDVDIICNVAKKLSIKPRKRALKSTTESESSIAQNALSTPKSHRSSLRHSALTPSIKMRTEALAKPVTPLQEVRSRLHVSAVPKSLPCREQEFNDIYTFLEGKLTDNIGGCIYISGVPGTGKTATVNEVVKCLKRSAEKGKLDQFNFIEINGMKLSEPRQAYVQILKQLTGKVLTWEQACNALEKRFGSKTEKSITLLLVDELDLLCTKRQDVIYNILDWPTKLSARLVVITIANTMDLPERVLMGRITSRLGLTRVTFQPYNHKQLQEIVLARLKDTDVFKSEAIQLIARKVSAVSGDARRALDICRRAAEITETRDGSTITMQDVNEALSEMIANPKVQAITHCSKFEQIFLQAVCAEVTRTGVEEVYFLNVYKQFESLCSFDGYEVPNVTQTLDICARLGDYRLLICEYAGNDIHQRILLNVSKDDIHYALQNISVD